MSEKRTLHEHAVLTAVATSCAKCGSSKPPRVEEGLFTCIHYSAGADIPEDWSRMVGTSFVCVDCGDRTRLGDRLLQAANQTKGK